MSKCPCRALLRSGEHIRTLLLRYYYYSHMIDAEMRTLRIKVTCPSFLSGFGAELELRGDLATWYIFTLAHTKSKVRSLPCAPSALETDWQCLPKGQASGIVWPVDCYIQTLLQRWTIWMKSMASQNHILGHQSALGLSFSFCFSFSSFSPPKFQTVWKASSNGKLCVTNPMEPFLTQSTPGAYEDLLWKVRCRKIWGKWKQLSLSLSLALSYSNWWSYLLAKKWVYKAP